MFVSKSISRSRAARPRRRPPSERIVTRVVKAVAESLERRMLLSVSASMVADINQATADSNPSVYGDLGNGKTVFYANDGFHGQEPFVTDGTAAGTTLLKDIDPGPFDSLQHFGIASSYSVNPVVASGRLFFNANDGVHGNELWTTDGTPAGTTLLKDINPGSGSSSPSEMVAIGNTVFFVANDGTDGWQLWRSDGTSDGTSMVTNFGTSAPGIPYGPPFIPRAFKGRLFFTADDGIHGQELWSTDGTAAGTTMFMDINPGQASSNAGWLTVCGSQLFFIANDGTNGSALWVTDGTSAGTHIVSNLVATIMTNVNGTLF
ncbi:MAG TPA: ELWxxDGT repeat protein, partial [Tepidisphaeraceae bacterium]|nr:ELWxxDGT repeat protein [Tepidisphaeraceae bacterium]